MGARCVPSVLIDLIFTHDYLKERRIREANARENRRE
jgi:hypothetical protein